ncbi:MAG: CapA family protein [Candidatus Saccharibacteria bacterium]|nr:CapA family protein [Candidatus Saccharibacteria bacterium]
MTKVLKKGRIAILAIVLVYVAIMTCIILKSINRTKESDDIRFSFDKSVTDEERSLITSSYGSTNPSSNKVVRISASTQSYAYTESENTLLIKISVPVVDMYSDILNITSAEADLCANNTASENSNKDNKINCKFVDLAYLTPSSRLVSIDNKYFLDDFNAGAIFRVIEVSADDKEIETATLDKLHQAFSSMNYSMNNVTGKTFSIAQTGVTAISRAMTTYLNNKAGGKGGFFAEKIASFLNKKDITHISNEVSFADGCQGGDTTLQLCADWRTIDTITAIGTDIVELTGNHNNDYGASSNIATIEKYESLGMKTYGGGKTEEIAQKPIRITTSNTADEKLSIIENAKGANITMLAYNESTSTKANGQLADGERPGANGYVEAIARADIKAAKERGDFVIVDVQFAECYCYPGDGNEYPDCDYPINGQQSLFRGLIDMGADMVVGTQAHQPQTFERYKDGVIYYGLGNLFFDQISWADTMKSLILTHYFINGKYVQTRITPTIYDDNFQTELMEEKDAEKYIKRLIKASDRGE